jgi:hypothetical protein
MTDWQRHFPTFLRWYRQITGAGPFQTTFVRRVAHLWTADNTIITLVVGREGILSTNWRFDAQDHTSSSREFVPFSQPIVNSDLIDMLDQFGLREQAVQVVLEAPWAAVKAFDMLPSDPRDPDTWIAGHRDDVIPNDLADDLLLKYRMFRCRSSTRLIVGLTRRSIVESLITVLEQKRAQILSIECGPLRFLDECLRTATDKPALCEMITAQRSRAYWFINENGIPEGWTELSLSTSSDTTTDEESSREEVWQRFGITNGERCRIVPIAHPSAPPISSQQIFKGIPPRLRVSTSTVADSASYSPAEFSFHVRLWALWGIRYSSYLVVACLILWMIVAGANALFTELGSGAEEWSYWQDRLEQLAREEDSIESQLKHAAPEPSPRFLLSPLWFEIGRAWPDSSWLSSIEFSGDGASGHAPPVILQGFTLGHASISLATKRLAGTFGAGVSLRSLDRVESRDRQNLPPHIASANVLRFSMIIPR